VSETRDYEAENCCRVTPHRRSPEQMDALDGYDNNGYDGAEARVIKVWACLASVHIILNGSHRRETR
jgi:hypothetical protein